MCVCVYIYFGILDPLTNVCVFVREEITIVYYHLINIKFMNRKYISSLLRYGFIRVSTESNS